MSINHLLLDIEGTTCPASFVSEILFPFARKSLSGFIARNQEKNDVRNILIAAQHEWEKDSSEASIKLREEHTARNNETHAEDMHIDELIIRIHAKQKAATPIVSLNKMLFASCVG